jgi:DNA-binding transcriptional LysR family regulator
MADFSPTGLRVLREVVESGSFTAAARRLGYTQSAVSRQIAALEALAARPLFERGRRGVALTPAGERLLIRATRVLDELDAARHEVAAVSGGHGLVRVGAFASAAATLVPAALVALADPHPELEVTVREGTTPTLVRALRAGTLDLAVVAQSPPFRPPDAEAPALDLTRLSEAELLVGVGPGHPFAGRRAVEIDELRDQRWVAGRSESGETLLGAWPGLPGRPDIRFVVRDWLAKTRIVAAGLAITTFPPSAAAALPPEIHLVAVRGEPQELRRIVLARLPGPLTPEAQAVAGALADAAHDAAGGQAGCRG